MSKIVVSDIFGKTPALVQLAKEINAKKIIDPYDGKNMSFTDENEAYSYFVNNVGIDTYLEKLQKALQLENSTNSLVGFSIGASIIWRLSETSSSQYVKNAVCFYGSQIRNFTNINPNFDTKLIFPKYEKHFDVEKLQNELVQKKNVEITTVNHFHGFMNYYSTNYNEKEYIKQIDLLRLN
ncbi:dienelactone hydrolase family protein [Sulfurospirillum arcachonense]|uniref:dienelactone hydrolase family protein n=1 Tax=Sulfurospirillum arcachonense TaxID=57666 RepID=UPI00046A41B4|nr:dienelactone hydrolase family protein [Sulfurospirillum arcachonense]